MIPEQSALLEKAKQSLDAARLLLDHQHYDFAVSRAYYAMFYIAESLLLGEGLSFSKHSGVIAAFGQHFTKTGRAPAEFHRYLIEGQLRRNTGDYAPVSEITEIQTQDQINHAEAFIQLGERLMNPENTE